MNPQANSLMIPASVLSWDFEGATRGSTLKRRGMAMAKPAKDKDQAASGGAEPDAPAKPFLSRRVGLLAVVAVFGALLFAAVELQRRSSLAPSARPGTTAMPAIGGPFSLVDQTGRPTTDKDFQGRFMLIYFGYTYCPDVCPTVLTEMAQAVDMLGPLGEKVTPVFITIDPERDRPEHLKEYIGYFHPRMVGLTGTPAQVAAAAKAYRVYSAKVAASKTDAMDYSMDHTSIVYLMGPDGAFKAHFTHGTTADALAKRIKEFL